MRILKEETVGLIIDIQERLFPHIHDHEMMARNTNILIRGLKAMEIPLVVTQQYTKGLGETVSLVRESIGHAEYIEKVAFSCCDETLFSDRLSSLGRKNVVMTGIEAHVCVLQTALDLIEMDYVPVIVEDCISSRKLNDKKTAISRLRREGAIITTYESILFELLRYSGTAEFKEVSRLVK